ncbi:FHA domain-containing protein [Streptomyces parvulus]|uniref:FHA domain-containing protein n=1 Tax=Streptomyces parvulus TaxID=146923 RepID=UPI0037B5999C
MQIRLTVVDPQGPHASAGGRAASSDVLVTAPAGTALAAVASALASALPGGETPGTGQVVLYAGAQRLDTQRSTLGEPPLIDGAVLCLGAPGEPDPHTEPADVPAQLHVVAGPDAGGVHLLHGGQIRLGRSADADVALDDPDVSRMHCAVTVTQDARVSVADLGSTNGTTLDGTRVGDRPVRFPPGALLRIGESALRLVPVPREAAARVATTPDGEGYVRLSAAPVPAPALGGADEVAHARVADGATGHGGVVDGPSRGAGASSGTARAGGSAGTDGTDGPSLGSPGAGGAGGWGGAAGLRHQADAAPGYAGPPQVPGQGGAPRVESHGTGPAAGFPRQTPAGGETHGAATSYGTAGPASGGSGTGGYGRGRYEEDHAGPGGSAGSGSRDGHAGPDRSAGSASRDGHAGPGRSAGSASRDGHAGPGRSAGSDSRDGGHGTGPAGVGRPDAGSSRDGGHATDAARAGGSASDTARRGGGRAPGPAEQAARGAEALGRDPYPAPPSAPGGPDAPPGRHSVTDGPDARLGRGSATDGIAPPGDPTPATFHAHPAATDAPGTRQPGTRQPGAPDPTGDDRPPGGGTGRKGTPLRGTDLPHGVRRRGGIGAWARRLTGGRGGAQDGPTTGTHAYDTATGPAPDAPGGASHAPETWPDPASLLLTALGPGPRLWERGPGHPEALTVRLGTADRVAPGGDAPLPAVPVTAGLREAGALGLAGPRARLAGLARSVLAQLAALHSADTLEIVLISADRSRPLAERTAEWSWLGWLPHLRPAHGQDCRLLLAHDREQAMARAHELVRRLEDHLSDARTGARPAAAATGTRQPSWARPDDGTDPAGGFAGPYSVVVVDGDPGGADVRETLARLALEGPRAGIHVLCLAETAAASPTSPVADTYEAACAVSPVFRACGAVALLSGDVATALRLLRVARTAGETPAGPVGHGTLGTVDAVSPAWAERFARALAPLRTDAPAGGERQARVAAPLPQAARLLDELGLARATPASLMARWADAADDAHALGGRAHAVLGAGPRGPVTVDLAAEGPHLLVEGPPGSGRTELLRALVASLASADRPDRLGVVLMDGRDGVGGDGGHGEGLAVCTDVPHVTTHLAANDPVRMREFAQSLSAELKRRAELLGRSEFPEWHTGREVSGRLVTQRTPHEDAPDDGDLDSPPSSTMRLRPGAARRRSGAVPPLPRLVVVVDDLDALVTPPLGSPGRPAAGSVMRALEAVAREGGRLGVHLVAATAPGGRTAQTEPALRAALRITLDAPAPGPDEPMPGRGRLTRPDGPAVVFQAGRVTGRIPRTATLRPTVIPLEWHLMGDPPTRRPVRELGNGPTDLALLASALERAAREVAAAQVPSLL